MEARFLDLEGDLEDLAEELDATLKQTSVRWLSAKPHFHYLFARYNAEIEVLHWEDAETIEASQWESLARLLAGEPAILLWSKSPLDATRKRLSDKGVQCVVLSTAANPSKDRDFFSVMRDNLDAIRSALESHSESAKPKA